MNSTVIPTTARDEPSISVAMATYNGGLHLEEQLASIAAQTVPPTELVVCDDGSVDRTVSIIRGFTETVPFDVRLVQNTVRLGYARNFLKAATLCRSDLIAFADQDDFWINTRLEIIRNAFRAADSPSVVVHSADLADPKLTPLGYRYPDIRKTTRLPPSRTVPLEIWSGLVLTFKRTLLSTIPLRFFDDIAAWDPSVGHDSWICFLAGIDGGFTLLNVSLLSYRQHPAQVTADDGEDRGIIVKLTKVIGTDSKDYLRVAEALEHWADVLRHAQDDEAATGNPASMLRRETTMRVQATRLRQRSALYMRDARVGRRLILVTSLIARRAYTPKWKGGLGSRAAVKDLGVALLGIR